MSKVDKFKLRGKLKNYDENVVFHGITIKSFYRPFSRVKDGHKWKDIKIECWMKYLFQATLFYLDKRFEGKPFFVSNSAIRETLNGYGNNYHLRTIQKAQKKLVDMNLIRVEPYPATPEELAINPNNHHSRRRVLIPNFDLILKCLNVYDKEDPILKELPDKHPLKKLIYKRPCSYVKEIESKCKEYMNERRTPYSNSTEMFAYFVKTKSSKYYDVSNLFNKFLPENLESKQEKVDKALMKRADRSKSSFILKSELDYYTENQFSMSDREMEELVGRRVVEDFMKQVIALGYAYNSKGIITSYKRPNNTHDKPPQALHELYNRM